MKPQNKSGIQMDPLPMREVGWGLQAPGLNTMNQWTDTPAFFMLKSVL